MAPEMAVKISSTTRSCLSSAIKDSSCLALMSEAAVKTRSGLESNRIVLVNKHKLFVLSFSLKIICQSNLLREFGDSLVEF